MLPTGIRTKNSPVQTELTEIEITTKIKPTIPCTEVQPVPKFHDIHPCFLSKPGNKQTHHRLKEDPDDTLWM